MTVPRVGAAVKEKGERLSRCTCRIITYPGTRSLLAREKNIAGLDSRRGAWTHNGSPSNAAPVLFRRPCNACGLYACAKLHHVRCSIRSPPDYEPALCSCNPHTIVWQTAHYRARVLFLELGEVPTACADKCTGGRRDDQKLLALPPLHRRRSVEDLNRESRHVSFDDYSFVTRVEIYGLISQSER